MLGAKGKAARGAAWATGANIGCQLLGLLFSFALARILNPRIFGLVALAWVYTAFMQIFVTQGFGLAIIQRKQLEEEHLNSAFWIGISTAVLFVIASVLLAAPIAALFKEPKLAPIINWLSLLMIFNALGSVPTAILTRDLEFRPLAIRALTTTGAGGVVGVLMAFWGYGIWSLVGQQLVGAALGCACLWFAVPWRPQLRVSKRHLQDLYGFSANIIGNDVLWFFSKRSDQTLVGYSFGPDGLGPYSLASKIISFVTDGIVGPLQSVAFPTLSKLQSDPAEFERAIYRYCEISAFLVFPIFTGIAAVAPELVPVLFGKKWVSAVPILQILAFYGMAFTAFSFTFPASVAKGRTGLQLITSTMLSAVTVLGCVAGSRFSPQAVAISLIVSYALFGVSFLFLLKRILQIRPAPLLRRLVYPFASSLLMLLTVLLLRAQLKRWLASPINLCICVVAGVALYAGIARLFRPDLIDELRDAFKAIVYKSGSKTPPRTITDLEEEQVSAPVGPES